MRQKRQNFSLRQPSQRKKIPNLDILRRPQPRLAAARLLHQAVIALTHVAKRITGKMTVTQPARQSKARTISQRMVVEEAM